LANQPSELPAFAKQSDEKAYLIDIERGKLRFEQERQDSLIDIDSATEGVRREDVLRELDRRIRRSDLIQADKIAWLGKVLDGLEARDISLVYCARHASRLADTIAARLEVLLQQGKLAAFRQTLFGDSATPAVNERFAFSFKPESYPASRLYNGPYRFKKHFYPAPGDLADDIATEETACAIAIDEMDEVRVWVRNLDSQPVTSFWLPTSNYRFYPDFVAELVDGRMLVVEYKGAHLLNDPKTVEKRDVGEVWARTSQNRCVFVMPTDAITAGKSVPDQIRKALKQK
jgi:type III restriction enzyme